MYLQRIEMQGFKSFAHKTGLHFIPGITAIVGPNGSGKSNIADAVRWVLGEQSLKTLRGKKSEDVIFAGSDKKTRAGFAEVGLVLNNEDRLAPVDYSEIVISRKIYRSGESDYFLNRNKVRLHDILMLLAKINFGQRSYSIISQGMVDLFLLTSPTERKEYFDEAAGVRQFQLKKEQAEHKMDTSRENLRQAEILIQEIEPRLRSLTRAVRRLERREEIEKNLKEIQYQYFSGLWHDLLEQYKTEEINFKKIDERKNITEKELADIQKNIQQLALESKRHEEYEKLQNEYNQLQLEKNKLLKDQSVIKGRVEVDYEKRGDFDLSMLYKRKDEINSELKIINEELKQIENGLKEKNSLLEIKNKEQEKIIGSINGTEQKLNEVKKFVQMKKMLTYGEIYEELEKIYQLQKAFFEKIEKVQTLDDLKKLKIEVEIITKRLSYFTQKLKSQNIPQPDEVLNLQEEISDLLEAKGNLMAEIHEIKIKLQVEKEKSDIFSKNREKNLQELDRISKDLERLESKKSVQDLKSQFDKENEEINRKIKDLDEKIDHLSGKIKEFNKDEQKKKEEVFSSQKKLTKKQDELNKIISDVNEIKIKLAKIETKKEDLEKEMVDELSQEIREEIYKSKKSFKPDPNLYPEMQKLKRSMELIGGIDPQVMAEYKETKERYDFLTTQSADLKKAIADLEIGIKNLEETIKNLFNKSFDKINKEFTKYFKILFNGGNARLSLIKEEILPEELLEDDENEVEEGEDVKQVTTEGTESAEISETTEKISKKKGEKVVTGIDIYACPPGKKLKGISMLSGGERALTSIALICAIIENNASPFVILDEVDAALDESNSIRFAAIIERISKKTQFILITHNRATMHKSGILYGVTMGDDGVSKLLSIKIEEAEKVIEQKGKK